MVKVVLASRSAHLYLGVLLLLCVPSYLLRLHTVPFELTDLHPGNRLPYSETCGVIAGVLGVALLRPRFWEWDRAATRRPMLLAALCALVGVTAPQLVVLAGATSLPEGFSWGYLAANALLYCAAVWALSPFVGVALAGGTVVVLYYVIGMLHNLAPAAVAFLPITPYPGPEAQWLPAVVLAVVAVILHALTRGSTAWSQRTFYRD